MTKWKVKGYCDESKCTYDVYTTDAIDGYIAQKQTTVCLQYGSQTINNTTATLNIEDTEDANLEMGAIKNSIGNEIEVATAVNIMRVKLSAFINLIASDNNTSVTIDICKKDAENEVTVLKSDSFYTGTNSSSGILVIPNFIASVNGDDKIYVRATTNGSITIQSNSYFTLETLDFYKTIEEED